MPFTSLVVLAVGLAMDAAAVAAARGLAAPVLRARHFLIVAAFFGGFQALMPFLGWQLGQRLGSVVAAWDHWIAFVLLGGIGIKMIHEATQRPADRSALADQDVFGLRVMLTLAVATSIDAFAVGVTLPMLDAPFALSLITIGITTAVLSALGLAIGRRFGAKVGHRMDMVGGVVLVGLGTKILIEHLTA
jgi:manganese efflux pump family protein